MMTTANVPFNNQQKLLSIIKFLKEQGFQILRSSAKGFDDPEKIVFKGTELGFTPDVIAETKGCKYLFSLEEYSESPGRENIYDKWLLFDSYAKQQRGLHYLVVPDSHVRHFKDLLAEWDLDSRILALQW